MAAAARRRSPPRWPASALAGRRGSRPACASARRPTCRRRASTSSTPSPAQLADIAGPALPARYVRRLRRFRYGPGVFKLDWALDGPDPVGGPGLPGGLDGAPGRHARGDRRRRGGSLARRAPGAALRADRASRASSTRLARPTGKHTGYAYCHVPAGSTVDLTEVVERQVERFAPGFRDRILARHATTPPPISSATTPTTWAARSPAASPTRRSSSRGRWRARSLLDAQPAHLDLLGVHAARRRRARHVRLPRGAARAEADRPARPGPLTA